MIVKTLLSLMVLIGLWGAGKLSYQQYLTGEACPILGDTVSACYIAFAGFALIAIGVGMSLVSAPLVGSYFFWGGMFIAGGLAALASVLELVKGNVCPVAFGSVPMCYISLAFSVAIALLFLFQPTSTSGV